nr:response regulator [Pseudoruegeria sp. HB172150]
MAVDDDPISLDLLEVLIGQIGGHVLVKSDSAADALDKIAQRGAAPFDCFLLDIEMPGMNGVELCEILRSIAVYRHSPILMITRKHEKRFIDDAFSAGASDYLTKPFELGELRTRMRMVEKLVNENRKRNDKLFAAKTTRKIRESQEHYELHAPVEIDDIPGVVEYHALENYLAQLSRRSLFGSTVFAVKIAGVERLHQKAEAFDFVCMITDTAEAISDSLSDHQALISYCGYGTFACVVEDGWRPNLDSFIDSVHKCLKLMDLHFGDGEEMNLVVCAGRPIRLLSKSGEQAVNALSQAQDSVEAVCREMEQSPLGAVLSKRSA